MKLIKNKYLGLVLLVAIFFLMFISLNVFAGCQKAGAENLDCENITTNSGGFCDNFPVCSWGASCTGELVGANCEDIDIAEGCANFTSNVCAWQEGENISFYGYTYNSSNNQLLGNTNVTVNVYTFGEQGPELNSTYSTISNGSGFFNMSVTSNSNHFYKPIVRHFNGPYVDYIGKTLPELPYFEFSRLANIKFFLWEGATINLTVYGSAGLNDSKNFSYMVKDTKLGYPVDELFNTNVYERIIYVPANRNYSISVFPNEAFPFNYEITNLTDYPSPKYLRLHLNASEGLIWVSGYATVNDSANFSDFHVIGYTVESGDMVFYDWPIPCNISSWRRNESGFPLDLTDNFNASNGFFNITLIGSAQTTNIILYAVANGGGVYYGAFRNISLTADSSDMIDFNFSLQPLIGSTLTNISCQVFDERQYIYIETKAVKFRLQNASGSSPNNAFMSVKTDYSQLGNKSFYWMTDLSSDDDGNATLPLLNSSVEIEVFTSDFSPKETTVTKDELAADIVNITLTAFNPGGIDEDMSGLYIGMFVNNDTCNVPYPSNSCSLLPEAELGNFNPFVVVLGGGELSFRMSKTSTGITVHYTNVDLLASGPPDAMFDSSANSSTNQSAIEQAWRFGSSGPDIYDSILLGIPYSDNEINDSSNISVLIDKLYDEDWNVVWSIDAGNTTDQVPSSYSDFPLYWFNVTAGGVLCNKTDETKACYINTSENQVWIQIPHFSGLGPSLYGEAPTILTQEETIALSYGWNLISLPLNITL